MSKTIEKKIIEEKKIYSPDEVRRILNSDNQEFQHLCKEFSILPKKDNATGKSYVSKKDVEILEKIKSIHAKGSKVIEQQKTKETNSLVATRPAMSNPVHTNTDLTNFADALETTRDTIIDKISAIIDEKLEGIDDVVVELIKCKSENERLKQKINELTKENYKVKNEIQSFKHLTLGLYIKSKDENAIMLSSYESKYVKISD